MVDATGADCSIPNSMNPSPVRSEALADRPGLWDKKESWRPVEADRQATTQFEKSAGTDGPTRVGRLRHDLLPPP